MWDLYNVADSNFTCFSTDVLLLLSNCWVSIKYFYSFESFYTGFLYYYRHNRIMLHPRILNILLKCSHLQRSCPRFWMSCGWTRKCWNINSWIYLYHNVFFLFCFFFNMQLKEYFEFSTIWVEIIVYVRNNWLRAVIS